MTGEYLTTQMCTKCHASDRNEDGTVNRDRRLLPRACAVGSQTLPSSESGQERRDQHLQGRGGHISKGGKRVLSGDQGLEEKCLKRTIT
jgi:hypothetical protein